MGGYKNVGGIEFSGFEILVDIMLIEEFLLFIFIILSELEYVVMVGSLGM